MTDQTRNGLSYAQAGVDIDARLRLMDTEMLRTFNCGIGVIAIVAPAAAHRLTTLSERCGERVVRLGHVTEQSAGVSCRGRLAPAG